MTRLILELLLVTSAAAAVVPSGSGGPKLITELTTTLRSSIDERKLGPVYEALQAHIAKRLDDSAGPKHHFDTSANCRLRWIDTLLRNPLTVPAEAERFTRLLHTWAQDDERGLHRIVAGAADRLDVPKSRRAWTKQQAEAAASKHGLERLTETLTALRAARGAAFSRVTPAEQTELAANLYTATTGTLRFGAVMEKRQPARRMCDLLEKVDRAALTDAAHLLVSLTDPKLLGELAKEMPGTAQLAGAEGRLSAVVDSPAGKILVGSAEANVYHLDQLTGVAAIVDHGGNDTYLEGALSAERSVLVTIDLAGNDTYRATQPGAQGGAVLGISLLVDRRGNDHYEADDVAQGASLAGVGVLVDMAGDDTYRAKRRVQGSAMAGIGILIDRGGKDAYRGALLAQGVGAPLGFGLLDDLTGDDTFYAGGLYADPYDDSPGYDAMSQGVGCGPRGVANGGVGVLLDGTGNDVYECDYFSHGGGYWFAAGFARDFAGNDQRVGATRTVFDGSKRTEPRFLRYGIGYGCHYAIGVVIDDAGNDLWGGDMAGLGFAWDLSFGGTFDFSGADHYTAVGGAAQGEAANCGVAVLFDAAGNDKYEGATQGLSQPPTEKSDLSVGTGDFSFVVDLAGNDTYGSKVTNGGVHQRGTVEGVVIDRAGGDK